MPPAHDEDEEEWQTDDGGDDADRYDRAWGYELGKNGSAAHYQGSSERCHR